MPLSGTYSIPGDYNTISDAAIALNTFGISGSVIFNVAVNHTETAPSGVSALLPGGIVFGNISGTSFTNTIVFQKSGIGTNPLVIAGENHFSGGIMDAIIKFVGSDHITFDGIDVSENPLNTITDIASNNMTEFGYAIFKNSNTDGAKNNSVKNCSINLNTGLTNYQNTIGIFSTTVTSSINGLLVSTASTQAGSNSDNVILNNSVVGANIGIAVIGSNTAVAMDSGWEIDGNLITGFGIGNGETMSAYQKLGVSIEGILINQCYNFTLQNNVITSISTTFTSAIQMAGIVMGWSGTISQPTAVGYTNTIRNNIIEVYQSFSENTFGIWSRIGNTSSKIEIENNSILIENNSLTAVSGKFTKGVLQEVIIGEFLCSENSVSINYEGVDHNHTVYFIQSDIPTSIKREILNNNLFTPIGKSLKTSGMVFGISHSGLSSGELIINLNKINIDKGNVSSASLLSGVYSHNQNSVAQPYEISGNEVDLITADIANLATNIYGVYNNDGTSATHKQIAENKINIHGYNSGGTTHGVFVAKSGTVYIIDNEISISNYSPTVNGIFFTTGSTVNIATNNKIIFSTDNIPNTQRVNGINNDIGQGNLTDNEINIYATVVSPLTSTFTAHGINNTKPNAVINNNSVDISALTSWVLVVNGIHNSASSGQISNNPLIKCYSTSTGTGAVTVSGINNLSTAINSIITSNSGIDVFSSANNGIVTVNGINNSAADVTITNNGLMKVNSTSGTTINARGILNTGSTTLIDQNNSIEVITNGSGTSNLRGIANSGSGTIISNNNLMKVNALTGASIDIRGISDAGSTTMISGNNSMEVTSNSATTSIAYGIISSGSDVIIQNNDFINVTGTAVSTSTLMIINNSGINAQIIENNNLFANSTSTTNISNTRGISSSVISQIKDNQNIVITSNAATSSTTHGILGLGSIENNEVEVIANAQTSITSSYGIRSESASIVRNNSILTNFTSETGGVGGYGLYSTGSDSLIENNTIDHTVISNGDETPLTWYGYVFGIRSGGNNSQLINNKIIKVYGSMGRGTTYLEVAGIFLENANNPVIENNLISNVSSNGTANNRVYLSGIYVIGASYNALIKNNRIFNLYFNNNITTLHPDYNTDIPANTNGIWVRIYDNQTLNDYTIVNNSISKLYHGNASKIGAVFGLTLSTKNINYKVYHNTILIGDNLTQITSNTTGNFGGSTVGFVNRLGSGGLDLRNNILYTNLLPRGTGYTSALGAIKSHDVIFSDFFTNPGQTGIRPVNYKAVSNNNLFYSPSVHGRRSYIYCEGDGFGTEYNRFNIDHNTIQANDPNFNINPSFSGCTSRYKTLMAGSDSDSFYQNVTLVEGTGDQEGVWTPIGETFAELGAQLIDPIYDLDFNGISRGNAIDMGAIQFNGQTVEAPEIVYSPLTLNGCGLVPTSLVLENVQITDSFGTITTGIFVPRLYYRIDSGAWSSVAGTLVSGDELNGFWNFTLTGLSAGTLSYYVIAQDKLSKIGAVPGSGLVACDVNSVTTHPTSPNTLTLGGAIATYALGSWSSTPDIGKAVVIDDDLVISSNLDACSVLVKSGRTVTVASDISLTVLNEVVVEAGANLIFEDKASLVQINNVANTGDIEYNRIASIKKLDYVYWSSPVVGSNGVSGFNINNLSANPTEITGPKYKWNTLQNNNNGTGGNISQGIWINANANLMESGKGYIVRAPNSFSETINQPYQATFSGVPFNGDLSYPIYRGDYTGLDYIGLNGQTITNLDDNFNLIGNPYPSAISAARFIYRNTPANGGSIIGGVRVWTHGNSPSISYQDPFYGSFAYNYTSNDYIIYTLLGSNCCPALEDDFMIGGGQGFFVQMQDGTAASDFAYFNNSMRSKNYTNANFYRTSNLIDFIDFTFEKHRIWLDVLDANLSSNRTLLGYAEGATFGLDDLYDATTKEIGALQIYSFAEDSKTTTQARPLPFDNNDEVSIGLNVPTQGQYTIAIAGIDGLFDYTSVYLKDNSLNLVHDLKESPYHFQAEKGVMNDRFQLVYQNSNLSQPDFNVGSVTAFVKNNEIHVKSSLDEINEITLFDLTGRKIYQKKIKTKETIISDLNIANQTILIQLKMSDNQLITKKIIF